MMRRGRGWGVGGEGGVLEGARSSMRRLGILVQESWVDGEDRCSYDGAA